MQTKLKTIDPILIFVAWRNYYSRILFKYVVHYLVKFKRNPLPLSLGDSANSWEKGIKCQNSNNCLKYHFDFSVFLKRYHFLCQIKEIFKIMKNNDYSTASVRFSRFSKKRKKMSLTYDSCPCSPVFFFFFKLSLYIQIPNIYLGLGHLFEFGPQRIMDLAIVCPYWHHSQFFISFVSNMWQRILKTLQFWGSS